jgi:serine protease Do
LLGLVLVGLAGHSGTGVAAESPALGLARQLNQAFIEVADGLALGRRRLGGPQGGLLECADGGQPLVGMAAPEMRKQMEEGFRQRRARGVAGAFDGQGSGIVVRDDGYIVTNGHVVEGADQIKVRFSNGKEYPPGCAAWTVQSDVAVIQIDAKSLPAAKFADSNKVRVGEFAIAIGAPFELDYSVTFGHVSARVAPRSFGSAMDQDFIQTDANINPGNSGGPLLNIEAEVIGINTMIRGLQTGIGFAIPSNLALEVANQLIEEGKFTRAWLGIEIGALREDEDLRGLVSGVEDGVVVRGIVKDGPAAKSDLKLRDVITTVDGQPVATAQELRANVRNRKIGSKLVLDVVREGKELKVEVSPEAWPEEMVAAARRGTSQTPQTHRPGHHGQAIDARRGKEMSIEFSEGVVVRCGPR